MRVAFASENGLNVDQHYGKARSFYVWEIGAEEAACVGRVKPPTGDEGDDLEGTLSARADSVGDCHILYTLKIGGPAAAKLVRRSVHPMKTPEVTPIAELVARLQDVLRNNPPPWLRKLTEAEVPQPRGDM